MDTGEIFVIILGALILVILIGWGLGKDDNIPTKRLEW